jgi:hypothetical protein
MFVHWIASGSSRSGSHSEGQHVESVLWMVGVLVAWVVLHVWLLPRLGVPT